MAMPAMRNLFQALLLLAALSATSLVCAIITMHFAIHGAEVHVPSLRGMTLDEARSQTAGLDLNLIVDHDYYSTDVAAGHIVSQSPAPGTVVRREWQVRVSQSLGPQRVQVPSVVGMQQRIALMALRTNGLQSGDADRLPDGSVPEGTVLAQDPPPHAQGIEQPSVHLLVAVADTGEANGFLMPDLHGKPFGSVRAALTQAGIHIAPPRMLDTPVAAVAPVTNGGAPVPPQPLVLPGSIVGQSPAAGTRIAVGDTLQLTVAR